MPRFAADGLELAYETYGGGDPVVLLHGFTSRGSTWVRNGWVDALVDAGLQAVSLDFPGHGDSDPPATDAACATHQLAADVVALLDHLGLGRASFLGFSLGAGVALQVALDAPGRTARLVVGGLGDGALNELHDPREVRALAANPRVRRNAELAGNDFDSLEPYLRQGGWPGGLEELQPPSVPVLLVVAGRDEYMHATRALLDRLRPAKIVTAPERGHHDVMLDETIRGEVVDFLRERD